MIYMYWVRHLWNSQSTFFGTNDRRSRLLVYDQHKAQMTKKVKDILQNQCKTTLVLVPPGATSKDQPLDVAVNSEFKKAVDCLATEAITRNPDQFLTRRLTASGKRIFFTKWTGQARNFSSPMGNYCFFLLRNVESRCLLQGNGIT